MKEWLSVLLICGGCWGISETFAEGLPANPWNARAVAVSAESTQQPLVAEAVAGQIRQDWQQLNGAVQNVTIPDMSALQDLTEGQPAAEEYVNYLQNQNAEIQKQEIEEESDYSVPEELKAKLTEVWNNLNQVNYEIPQKSSDTAKSLRQANKADAELDWKTQAQINKANREYKRYKNKAVANYKALRRSAESLGNKVKKSVKTVEKNTEAVLDKIK